MKKLFFYAVVACCATMCLTGCINNDSSDSNYHTLTVNEKTTIMGAMTGSYSGDMLYYEPGTSLEKIDTVAAEWAFNSDTTTVVQFPVSVLASFMDTTEVFSEAKALLAKAPVMPIECYAYCPSAVSVSLWNEAWSLGSYRFPMVPKSLDFSFNLGTHTYAIQFLNTYLSSAYTTYYPVFLYEDGVSECHFLINSLTVDGQYVSNFPTVMVFTGKKK